MGSAASRPKSPRPVSRGGLTPRGSVPAGRRASSTLELNADAKDVMISYSHADKETMLMLREGLEDHGISVWVDVTGLRAGVDFLGKIGEAIIDSKVFISLLSTKTVESRYCQDELALAYVSNKPIFPIGIEDPAQLFPLMDTGMKLQLARFEWSLFLDNSKFDENLEKLVERMKKIMEKDAEPVHAVGEHSAEPAQPQPAAKHTFRRMQSLMSGTEPTQSQPAAKHTFRRMQSLMSGAAAIMEGQPVVTLDDATLNTFWERHFSDQEKVKEESFLTAFHEEYATALSAMFDKSDMEWVDSILHRELNVGEHDGNVTKRDYIEFCTVDGQFAPFWDRMQAKCVESYAMKEVFNMDSSVRVQAIEHLGKFKSEFVIEALLDLLSDRDNNVRVVAAISLAKTNTERKDVWNRLIGCLTDNDRLVRESACLALGRLRVKEAVPKIMHLWRNDFISSVREAAQVALGQIGGDEANKAMHMTKVLAEEIRMLTN